MKYSLLITGLAYILLLSCSSPAGQPKPEVTGAQPAKDAVRMGAAEQPYFTQRILFTGKGYSLLLKSTYNLPDVLQHDSAHYCQGSFLIAVGEKGKAMDSIQLAEECRDVSEVSDLTKQLGVIPSFLRVAIRSDSDMFTNVFVEYRDGVLKKLFELTDYTTVELEKTDAQTLTGTIKETDEDLLILVPCPVEISLKDYSIKTKLPAQQKIDYPTTALADFEGYELVNGSKKAHQVKQGDSVVINFIDRKTKTVTMIVDASRVIYVPVSKLKLKMYTAG